MNLRCIYCITNMVNGKVYIGQTNSLKNRKAKHLCGARNGKNHPLYDSIRKHGESVFVFHVLEECTDDAVDEHERYWIDHFQSRDRRFGYNLESGGCKGKKLSDETRQKISKAKKGKCLSLETRKRMSESRKGKRHSAETRCKMSATQKRRSHLRSAGWHHSEETKRKIAKAVKGKLKGRKLSMETRMKLSEAAKRQWERKKSSGSN